jgi:hypothetical protein
MQPITQYNPGVPKFDSLQDVVKDSSVIKLYANGFQSTAGLADATILLKLQDVTVGMLSMSLPALKSLHGQLGLILNAYTTNLKQPVLSFEELNEIAKQQNTNSK